MHCLTTGDDYVDYDSDDYTAAPGQSGNAAHADPYAGAAHPRLFLLDQVSCRKRRHLLFERPQGRSHRSRGIPGI